MVAARVLLTVAVVPAVLLSPTLSLKRRQQRSGGEEQGAAAVAAPPGAPEQLKLSLAGGPETMVVSWISKDAVPTDGTCFDRPAQVWSADGSCANGGCSGSSDHES